MLHASELNCRRLTSLDHLKATSKTSYSFSVIFLVILMYITSLSLSRSLSLSLICCAVLLYFLELSF